MAVLKRVLRIAVPGAVGAFLIWQIWLNWQEVGSRIAQANPWYLIAAFFANLLLYPLWVLIWYLILRELGQPLPYRVSFPIAIVANFAKYLPGVVWQYLGRIELAKREGLPRAVTFASLVYEVIAYLIAGVMWTLVYFGNVMIGAALVVGLAVILLLPRLLELARKRIKRLGQLPERTLSAKGWVTIVVVTLAEYFSTGLALWFILLALGQQGFDPFRLTAIYALSWMVGYLTLVAPGGLGIADATLVGILTPSLGIGLASLIAIILRLIMLGNELLLGLLVVKSIQKSLPKG